MAEYIKREDAVRVIEDKMGHLMYFSVEHHAYSDTVYMINNLHAADVAEVKHGRWIKLSKGDVCSSCKYTTGRYETSGNYCPNCGAKMDVED